VHTPCTYCSNDTYKPIHIFKFSMFHFASVLLCFPFPSSRRWWFTNFVNTRAHFFPICNRNISLRSEVLTAVITKISVFLDIMSCSPLKINRFGRICGLHLHDRRIRQSRNQHETGSKQNDNSLTLRMKASCTYETSADFQRTIPKRRLIVNRLHGIVSEKTETLKEYFFPDKPLE
jgi:hypothetical protein